MISFKFPAIGTKWQIDLPEKISNTQKLLIKNKILSRIAEFDSIYSRFRSDSWVVANSKASSTTKIPAEAKKMLDLYLELYKISGTLFTPLIGRTLEDAGYDASYSLKPKDVIKRPPEFEKAISWDLDKITFKMPVLLDFGAAGKGYLVDVIGHLLKKEGLNFFCIDAGGDILYEGKEPMRIGLEHPDDPTLAIGIATIKNESICGSSGNRRKWDKYHHTINPITLTSPENVKATWVVAKNAILADALSTCLFLDPMPEKYSDFVFEYVLLYKDNTAQKSPNFPGELFTS